MHLPDLLKDLAIILGLAGIVSLVFRRLGQPVVLGYILAGILAGPHIPWVPTVTDLPNIQVLAELGVIFLLFSLGLEFSFGKLLKTGLAATTIALLEIGLMGAIGFAFGQLLGWSVMDCVFLGAILSMSSTTIIIRAIAELNLKSQRFTQVVFGVLIMEDLVAILILVALSTIAVSREVQGAALLASLGKLALILPIVILAGLYLVPRIFKISRRWMNDEGLLIFSIGLCLGLVLLSSALGYSAALGAFLAGAILAESPLGEKIEELVEPVRNLFGAIFFVSVGMLFDPSILADHGWAVVLITLVTIVGKALATGFGALAAGQGTRTSVQVGFSMAQIGEFSFIIASLGASLKVTSDFLYPLAVAVAVVTSFTTPYQIRGSAAFADWLEGRIPRRVRDLLRRYEVSLSRIGTLTANSGFKSKLLAYTDILGRLVKAEPLPYQDLAPWSAHLDRIRIAPGSPLAGRTLRELNVRGRTGANILVIERSGTSTAAPNPDQALLPMDEIVVLGTDEQIEALRPLVEAKTDTVFDATEERGAATYSLGSVLVREGSRLAGHTIREAGIRESFGGLVVGVERGGRRMTNPDSNLTLLPGDILWVVSPTSRKAEIAGLASEPTPR